MERMRCVDGVILHLVSEKDQGVDTATDTFMPIITHQPFRNPSLSLPLLHLHRHVDKNSWMRPFQADFLTTRYQHQHLAVHFNKTECLKPCLYNDIFHHSTHLTFTMPQFQRLRIYQRAAQRSLHPLHPLPIWKFAKRHSDWGRRGLSVTKILWRFLPKFFQCTIYILF